jgi:hypothetical protein
MNLFGLHEEESPGRHFFPANTDRDLGQTSFRNHGGLIRIKNQ